MKAPPAHTPWREGLLPLGLLATGAALAAYARGRVATPLPAGPPAGGTGAPWFTDAATQAMVQAGASLLLLACLTAGTALAILWCWRHLHGQQLFFPRSELLRAPWAWHAIAGCCGIVLIGVALPGALLRLRGLTDPIPFGESIFAFFMAEVAGGLYALKHLRRNDHPARPRWPGGEEALRQALRGVAAWLAFTPVLFGLALLSASLLAAHDGTPAETDLALQLLQQARGAPGLLAGLLVLIIVVAPVVEELFFRGLLHGVLRRHFSLPLAALAGGLLFSLAHGSVWKLTPITALGIFLCHLRERSGSLIPPIAAHMANNGVVALVCLASMDV